MNNENIDATKRLQSGNDIYDEELWD